MGKPLKPITPPLRADLPIFLGAEGPKNVALAAEQCDGWLPLWNSPFKPEVYAASLQNAKPGFEIVQNVNVKLTDDVQAAIDASKPMLGFYIGGMGSRKRNFHKELMARMGYEGEAQKIQDLFFDGQRGEAIAAVPDSFIDEISLIGPIERIRDRLAAWRESPITTITLGGADSELMRTMAELVDA